MTPTASARLGAVLLVLLALGWGGTWPVLKIVLQDMPVWTFRVWSTLAAAACLLAFARLAGDRIRPAPGEWRWVALGGIFNVTLWHIMVAYGTKMMASGHASVLGFTMPLWAALIGAAWLGEKLTGRVLAALALGAGGIFVLLSRDLQAVGQSPWGAMLILGAAVSWAVGTHVQKRAPWTLGTFALAAWQLFAGVVPMAVVLPFVEEVGMPRASWTGWLCFAYVTLVSIVLCYWLWFRIVQIFPANIAAIGTLLTPVVGVLSGTLILGEAFGWREAAALLLVGSALALVLIVPARRQPAAAAASAG